MGISLSILLIAAGAVLAWAVNAEVSGVDIQLVGVILLDRRHHRTRHLAHLLVELGWFRRDVRRRSEHDHRRA